MTTNVLKKGVSIRDLAHGLIPAQFEELFLEMHRVQEEVMRIADHKTKFENLVSEMGWASTEEFLTKTGYLVLLPVKRNRVKLTSEQRTQIVEILKLGVKSTKEIVTEFGITADTVYSICSKAGLSTPRTKKAVSSSESVAPKQSQVLLAA